MQPVLVASMTGDYNESVSLRDAAPGRVLAEPDFLEPMEPNGRLAPGMAVASPGKPRTVHRPAGDAGVEADVAGRIPVITAEGSPLSIEEILPA